MILVTVKSKFQIVIPHEIARQLNIKVGDILEASVERGELVPELCTGTALHRHPRAHYHLRSP